MTTKKAANVGKDCVACGNCVKHCPLDAIMIYRGLYAKVDKDICKACQKCVKACPADVIEMRTEAIVV